MNAGSSGMLGAFGGFLMSFFVSGYKIGKVEEKMTAKLEEHDKTITDLQNNFRDQSGGLRFLTVVGHESACLKNNEVIRQALHHLTEAVKDNTKATDINCEKVQSLEVVVAVLQEKSK